MAATGVKKISIADLTLDVWLYVLLIKDVDRAASPTDHCARHKQLQVLFYKGSIK